MIGTWIQTIIYWFITWNKILSCSALRKCLLYFEVNIWLIEPFIHFGLKFFVFVLKFQKIKTLLRHSLSRCIISINRRWLELIQCNFWLKFILNLSTFHEYLFKKFTCFSVMPNIKSVLMCASVSLSSRTTNIFKSARILNNQNN